jgi:hypothetical protein
MYIPALGSFHLREAKFIDLPWQLNMTQSMHGIVRTCQAVIKCTSPLVFVRLESEIKNYCFWKTEAASLRGTTNPSSLDPHPTFFNTIVGNQG